METEEMGQGGKQVTALQSSKTDSYVLMLNWMSAQHGMFQVRLPPLNKQFSMSLPSMVQEYVDPRDVKMNELEKVESSVEKDNCLIQVIAQYQDKLNDVTSNYQKKIGIIIIKERRLI